MQPRGSVPRQGPGQACDVNEVHVGMNYKCRKVIRKFGWLTRFFPDLGIHKLLKSCKM